MFTLTDDLGKTYRGLVILHFELLYDIFNSLSKMLGETKLWGLGASSSLSYIYLLCKVCSYMPIAGGMVYELVFGLQTVMRTKYSDNFALFGYAVIRRPQYKFSLDCPLSTGLSNSRQKS